LHALHICNSVELGYLCLMKELNNVMLLPAAAFSAPQEAGLPVNNTVRAEVTNFVIEQQQSLEERAGLCGCGLVGHHQQCVVT
jgi:hypothetical protein